MPPTPKTASAPATDKVKCRVTASQYRLTNPAFKGEEVEVTRAEYERHRVEDVDGRGRATGRYSYPVLISLDDEKTLLEAKEKPIATARSRAEVERARVESRQKRDKQRDELLRKGVVERAQAVVASGGLVAGTK